MNSALLSFLFSTLIILNLVSLVNSNSASLTKGSIYYSGPGAKPVIKYILDPSATASAVFDNTVSQNGHSVLHVKTNSSFADDTQLFAAGYLEGVLTSALIEDLFQDVWNVVFTSPPSQKLKEYIANQKIYIDNQCKKAETDYWKIACSTQNQLYGLMQGYNSVAKTPLSYFDFMVLAATGDFEDLTSAFDPAEMKKDISFWQNNATYNDAFKAYTSGHCSALIKVTPTMDQLFAAHTTWFSMEAMIRIYKYYDLNTHLAPIKMGFSSFAGALVSIDSFYQTSNNLWISETTNDVFDKSLYAHLTPNSLLSWMRVRIASALSKSGSEWTKWFSIQNSGTYNNQWMIVDYNKFTPKKMFQNGTLFILEQLPGLIVSKDMTEYLFLGYWGSYNVPFFPEIFEKAGYQSMADKFPEMFSHDCVRAQIFRRNQTDVQTITDMQKMIRYNNYKHDPLSKDNPGFAIASRFDLDTTHPIPFGALDGKISTNELNPTLTAHYVTAPTHDQQPVFNWSEFPSHDLHIGEPQIWDFEWDIVKPFDFPTK